MGLLGNTSWFNIFGPLGGLSSGISRASQGRGTCTMPGISGTTSNVLQNMAQTNLYGPFNLNEEGVDLNASGVGPGAYVLGRINIVNNFFVVVYVGRSDNDLNKRLKAHVGEDYLLFKHAYYKTAKAAYDKECWLWHDFGGDKGDLDNKVHPDKGVNRDWNCSVCGE